MEYEFETYRRHHGRALGQALIITLSPNGMIRLSGGAYEALGQPTDVELLFDREQQVIGIRAPLRARSDDAFEVRRPLFGGSHYISAKSFVSFHSLDFGRTRRLAALFQDGLLCVPTRVQDVK
jgi:hypothetical protein